MKKLLFAAFLFIALAALLAACGSTPSTSTTTPPAGTTSTGAPTTTTTGAVINTPGTGPTAKDGDTVSVNYIGTLQDGTKFDSSYDRGQPLSFVLGAGQMISGFDSAVVGMQVGETKTVTLTPDQAYGPHSDSLIITLDRSQFPDGASLSVGQQVPLQNSAGQQLTGVITKLDPGSVTVDLNPPLAGKTLTFQITLESITPGTATPTSGG